ncbi:unnamed protein product [Rhizophagus irregularis]|nr:unnamed protein product [Rhizophagus irregularis]
MIVKLSENYQKSKIKKERINMNLIRFRNYFSCCENEDGGNKTRGNEGRPLNLNKDLRYIECGSRYLIGGPQKEWTSRNQNKRRTYYKGESRIIEERSLIVDIKN